MTVPERDNDGYDKDETWVPPIAERGPEDSLFISSVVAHSLLINSNNLSDSDREKLRHIIDDDLHPDQRVDLFSYGNSDTSLDGGYHDDDDGDWIND